MKLSYWGVDLKTLCLSYLQNIITFGNHSLFVCFNRGSSTLLTEFIAMHSFAFVHKLKIA